MSGTRRRSVPGSLELIAASADSRTGDRELQPRQPRPRHLPGFIRSQGQPSGDAAAFKRGREFRLKVSGPCTCRRRQASRQSEAAGTGGAAF